MGVPELPITPDGWLALEAAQVIVLRDLEQPSARGLIHTVNRVAWSITGRTWDQERAEDVYGVRVARGPA
jgi:hypothetical protein